MQRVIVTGNLGADATIQNYQGNQFMTMRVAATDKFTSNGNQETITTWYDCTWNKADSKLLPYLKKGQKVLIIGRPRYRIYDSAVHRCKMVGISVFIESIELCGGAADSNNNQSAESSQADNNAGDPQPANATNDAPPF